jgi:hypothetical protein
LEDWQGLSTAAAAHQLLLLLKAFNVLLTRESNVAGAAKAVWAGSICCLHKLHEHIYQGLSGLMNSTAGSTVFRDT